MGTSTFCNESEASRIARPSTMHSGHVSAIASSYYSDPIQTSRPLGSGENEHSTSIPNPTYDLPSGYYAQQTATDTSYNSDQFQIVHPSGSGEDEHSTSIPNPIYNLPSGYYTQQTATDTLYNSDQIQTVHPSGSGEDEHSTSIPNPIYDLHCGWYAQQTAIDTLYNSGPIQTPHLSGLGENEQSTSVPNFIFDLPSVYYAQQTHSDIPSSYQIVPLLYSQSSEKNERPIGLPTSHQNWLPSVGTQNVYRSSCFQSSDQARSFSTLRSDEYYVHHQNQPLVGHSSSHQPQSLGGTNSGENLNSKVRFSASSATLDRLSTGLYPQSGDSQCSNIRTALTTAQSLSGSESRVQRNWLMLVGNTSIQDGAYAQKISEEGSLIKYSTATIQAPDGAEQDGKGIQKYDLDSHSLTTTCRKLEELWKCYVCGLKFILESDMKDHFKKQNHPYKCFICDQAYRHQYKCHLKKHFFSCHYPVGRSRLTWPCDRCDETLPTSEDLKSHLITHNGEEPFKCDRCTTKFSREGDLNWHYYDQHSYQVNPFKCDRCNRRFFQNRDLRQHHCAKHALEIAVLSGVLNSTVAKSQADDKPRLQPNRVIPVRTTSIRGRAWAQKISEKGSLIKYSTTTIQAPDSIEWGEKCTPKHNLQSGPPNMTFRKLEESWKCYVCGLKFILESDMKDHFKKQNHPYKCFICGQVYCQYKCRLKKHFFSCHHPVGRSRLTWPCDRCDETLLTSEDLKSHLITHNGEEPFKCDRCTTKFSREGDLNWHYYDQHSYQVKPFKCDICNERFFRNRDLKRHHCAKHALEVAVSNEDRNSTVAQSQLSSVSRLYSNQLKCR